ncbi:nitrilase family protein [Maribacter sp. MJ134]|uniref:nitrilase family protein n=1 Tax=Maribacter sp. MJ134 TaxID=2496865 RepID=UPI000F8443B9|nr:nitrilase family protein [Maribacter sp. MJ134]AZQ60036.1 nitrilase family protein [Maribacter sp. MJ134]
MQEALKIVLVQTSLIWENPKKNRAILSKKLEGLKGDIDVIVLPEMFTTGFTMSPVHIEEEEGKKTVAWMQKKAKETGAAIIGSIVFKEGECYYNRLWFVKPDGSSSSYDKRHTFTLAGEDKKYVAGSKKLLETYKGFKFCPLICYDLRFPVWSRNTEAYDVLLYVANWPKPRIGAWDTLLKARAIENMAYCVGVNRIGTDDSGHEYPGHSAVYDALGKRITFSDKEECIEITVHKNHIKKTRDTLGFLDDRDSFELILQTNF